MNETNNTQAILDAGGAIGQPVTASADYAIVPKGYELHALEQFHEFPSRKRAKVTMHDTESFIDYTKMHGSLASCVVYADIDQITSKARYIAVIDDHKADVDEPRWRDHICTYTPKTSVEWDRWVGSNKRQMTQADFAAWLEDNLPDIASQDGMPSGSDMLQMALNFERNATKRYKQKLDLQGGGIQFEYVDDEDKDTRTQMKVFERFTIGIRVFLNDDGYAIQARLKYRENGGKLSFWYELIREDKVFDAASKDIVAAIREKTGMKVLIGNPNL